MNKRGDDILVATLLFALRWALMSVGLWVAVRLFGREQVTDVWTSIATFLLAGLIFSAVNTIVKPILTFVSIPFIVVTLGIFTLIINGLMVWLAVNLVPNISMGFSGAIVSGLVLSMINYLISNINEMVEDYHSGRRS